MKILVGYSRIVFIFNKFVIKIPRILYLFRQTSFKYALKTLYYGFIANMEEKRTWDIVKNTKIKHRYAIMYFSCPLGLFNIMEKVNTYNNFRNKHVNNFWSNYLSKVLKEIEKETGKEMIVDTNRYNFGFRGRTLVILDYA
jgi:hypothetical protein